MTNQLPSMFTILVITGIYTPLASVFGALIIYSAPTTEISFKDSLKNILHFNGLVLGCTLIAGIIIYIITLIL